MKILNTKTKQKNFDEFKKYVKEIIHKEKYKKLRQFIQHGRTSTYKHSLCVAYKSFCLARFLHLKVNIQNLIQGALLHDYVFYDWHTHGDKLHGFHHPKIALENAKKDFIINDEVAKIIKNHMWPLNILDIPNTKESILVCLVDKLSSIKETFYRKK